MLQGCKDMIFCQCLDSFGGPLGNELTIVVKRGNMGIIVIFADDDRYFSSAPQDIVHSDMSIIKMHVPAIKFGNTCTGRIGWRSIDAAGITGILMPAHRVRERIGILQEIAQVIIVVLEVDGANELAV